MNSSKYKKLIIVALKQTSFGMKLLRYHYLKKESYDKALQITRALKIHNVSNILIVCRKVKEYGFNEAINREALLFFKEIKNYYKVKLISVEYDIETIKKEGEINFIPFTDFPKYLSLQPAELIHIFDSKIEDIFNYNFALENFKVISTLTSNEPVNKSDIGEFDLSRIVHAVDHKLLRLIVHSKKAEKVLYHLGIKADRMLLPFVSTTFQKHRRKTLECIGFASSPLQPSDIEKKGILLLKEIAKNNSQIKFLVAWRNKSISDDDLGKLKNVTILYNPAEMSEFYNNIDCMIIPFTDKDNHAAPFSCIEALSCHIPVIITNVLDIADIIEKFGWGIVCNPDVKDISDAIQLLMNRYETFLQSLLRKNVYEVFDEECYITNMKEVYDESIKTIQSISLQKWENALEAEKKELILGRESMKNYYNECSVVQEYFQKRFGEDKHFKLHQEQMSAVEKILQKYFQDAPSDDTYILDLATGTGRLVHILSDFGKVVLIDSSFNMLKSLQNNHIKICGDLFNLPLKHYFDCITLFRVLRHYQFFDRKQLYANLYKSLKQGGIVLCDVPSRSTEIEMRNIQGWQKYNIYDCFWELPNFEKEIVLFGFKLYEHIPIGYSLTSEYERISGKPVEQICAIQKV
jgi:glycosyltransferase involved in cell wall biosynthesis/SAM-dependent methyltransferase